MKPLVWIERELFLLRHRTCQ